MTDEVVHNLIKSSFPTHFITGLYETYRHHSKKKKQIGKKYLVMKKNDLSDVSCLHAGM